MIDERYSRNIGTLTEAENIELAQKRVCVVGCGGLGGYVIEALGRVGVGHITAVDYDVFEASNLNRQLTSEVSLLGVNKATAAKERMGRVNPLISVRAVDAKLEEANAAELLSGHDVVVDALDSLPPRLLLQKVCEEFDIPLVHGAIGGWFGYVTVIMPKDRTLEKLYNIEAQRGMETVLGNPSFTPAVIGSIQACETVKLLIGRGDPLCGRMLSVDLLHQEYVVFSLK